MLREMDTTVLCMAVCVSLAQVALCQELVLVDQGESAYRIVVAVDASIQDYYAAQQLQQYIEEMSGVKAPIVGDDNALTETEIIVGFNRHFDRLGLEVKKDSFSPEEFLIKTVGQTLVIIGGTPRGVLYGVNSLLTDDWGCRWFTPNLKRTPKFERLTLPATERRYQPPFEWREVGYWAGMHNDWVFHNFLMYERGQDWVKQVMGDDVLADIFLADQPAGQFLGTGTIMHSYWDFFRYEWMAFARRILAGEKLSPSIHDGYKTVCLTEGICASLRSDSPKQVIY